MGGRAGPFTATRTYSADTGPSHGNHGNTALRGGVGEGSQKKRQEECLAICMLLNNITKVSLTWVPFCGTTFLFLYVMPIALNFQKTMSEQWLYSWSGSFFSLTYNNFLYYYNNVVRSFIVFNMSG